ncbi:unnamed protein product, partial [Brenthis ino]
MVLSEASFLNSYSALRSSPFKGFIEALSVISKGIFLKVCKACQENMASIPPSAFSARRIRETQRDMKVSNIKKGTEPPQYFHTKLTELTPLKYNSKLMNSIWGFYNRYSPHNVKKINDALTFNQELQQSAANSSNKIQSETMLTLPATKLENVWASINVSQSH